MTKRHDEAVEMLSQAVEELPGNVRLITAESAYGGGGPLTTDIHALVLGVALAPDQPGDTGDDEADAAAAPRFFP